MISIKMYRSGNQYLVKFWLQHKTRMLLWLPNRKKWKIGKKICFWRSTIWQSKLDGSLQQRKKSVITTKAILVARGFVNEGIDKGKTDSPTCSRESLSPIQSLLSMKKWKVKLLIYKTAFLQGNPLKREVYLKSPKDF